jgi:hypothetical protein
MALAAMTDRRLASIVSRPFACGEVEKLSVVVQRADLDPPA